MNIQDMTTHIDMTMHIIAQGQTISVQNSDNDIGRQAPTEAGKDARRAEIEANIEKMPFAARALRPIYRLLDKTSDIMEKTSIPLAIVGGVVGFIAAPVAGIGALGIGAAAALASYALPTAIGKGAEIAADRVLESFGEAYRKVEDPFHDTPDQSSLPRMVYVPAIDGAGAPLPEHDSSPAVSRFQAAPKTEAASPQVKSKSTPPSPK